MDVKTILVPVTGTDAGLPGIDAAFQIAAYIGAHVEGLHARRNARDALAYIGEGMTGAMIEELITTAEQESTTNAQRARQDFAAACEKAGFVQTERRGGPDQLTAHLLMEIGAEDELVALRGRVADLIVVTRASRDDDPILRTTLESAMFESGRPLFVVPPEGMIRPLTSAVIAWNGSAEAARVVTHALPLLAKAERVAVILVEEGLRPGPSADDLIAYLARHDIIATTHMTNLDHSTIGEALLTDARDIGAGFMIMGAYTHSRLRRMIMGSATEFMLGAADLPVLMTH
jgi:nucleotide-binding universal stress UspA family protein